MMLLGNILKLLQIIKNKMNLYITKKDFREPEYEFVERKGQGHPDSLSDDLAEYLSSNYSRYTLDKFGVILHHNFDKVGLLGGASEVGFGYGRMVSPIRVLINGRASYKFGEENIDIKSLLIKWSKEFLTKKLPIIEDDLEIHYNLSTQSSPGKTEEDDNKNNSARNYWFEPRDKNDIPELQKLVSNDTSMGVGFYPFSRLENLVLSIENKLNSSEFKDENPWIGSDIKIMGFRMGDTFKITMCIPQLGAFVKSIDEYKNNLDICKSVINRIAQDVDINDLELNINTRDNYEKGEFYLTAIGSSIESGDEGLVGRGNRIQGIISPTRLMSMEGAAGKNPVYHIGKIYYIAAQKISESIYNEFGLKNEVALVSQSGRELLDPWIIHITIPDNSCNETELKNLIESEIKSIPEITKDLINLSIKIC